MSNDFLDFLVSETFKLQEHGKENLHSLERKINDYHLTYIKGEFIPALNVIRFQTDLGNLDAPISWCIFSFEESNDSSLYQEHQDSEGVLSVLGKKICSDSSKALVTQDAGFFYIIFFKRTDESLLSVFLHQESELKNAA